MPLLGGRFAWLLKPMIDKERIHPIRALQVFAKALLFVIKAAILKGDTHVVVEVM